MNTLNNFSTKIKVTGFEFSPFIVGIKIIFS